MNLTQKQRALLEVIARGNKDGSKVDMRQLTDLLPYKPSLESLHFSIRALVKHGLIEKMPLEKREGRLKRPLQVTPLGMHFSCIHITTPKVIVTEEVEELSRELDELGLNLDS